MLRRYLQDGVQPVFQPRIDEEEEDGPRDAGSDPFTGSLDTEGQPSGQGVGAYMGGDEGGPLAPAVPGMPGVSADMLDQPAQSAQPPAAPATLPKHLNWIQKALDIATRHPGATPPTDTGEMAPLPETLKTLSKVYNQYPQRQVPNWLERIAAGALGAAAGYSNAARRAAPIDIGKVTEGVLYPGYDSKLAAWQSRVVPAQQAVEMAGQVVGAQQKAQLNVAEVALKQAQAQQAEGLGRGGMMTVTPEMEKATNGILKAGTQVSGIAVSSALNDAAGRYAKKTPVTAMEKLTDLKQAFPNRTDEWYSQRLYPTAGRVTPPTEASVKDTQIRADFASLTGKEPAAVTEAEMNTARRMYGAGDPLITSGLRTFVYQNKRLPTPPEENGIINRAKLASAADRRNPEMDAAAAIRKQEDLDRVGTWATDERNRILNHRQSEMDRIAAAKRALTLPNANRNDVNTQNAALDAQLATIHQQAARELQSIQDQYAIRARSRNVQGVTDYNVGVAPNGDIQYMPRPLTGAPKPFVGPPAPPVPPAPPQTAPVTAQPPRLPAPTRPAAQAALPPSTSGPVHVMLPGGKAKIFPNQQALDAFSAETGLTFSKQQ